MIEIDDAGSGSLIGGTGIGIMRRETGEYIFKIIPLSLFQEPYFQEKYYQKYVVKIVHSAFGRLNVFTEEPIRICRGYVFDDLRKWLTEQGYNWESTKIEGPLQEKVEESFNNYVIELGLPRNFVIHARYAYGFHRLLKWVFADFKDRSILCKTGWKSWNKWSKVKITTYTNHAEKPGFCLRCGRQIKQNERITTIEYTTNRLWSVELHAYCSSSPAVISIPGN